MKKQSEPNPLETLLKWENELKNVYKVINDKVTRFNNLVRGIEWQEGILDQLDSQTAELISNIRCLKEVVGTKLDALDTSGAGINVEEVQKAYHGFFTTIYNPPSDGASSIPWREHIVGTVQSLTSHVGNNLPSEKVIGCGTGLHQEDFAGDDPGDNDGGFAAGALDAPEQASCFLDAGAEGISNDMRDSTKRVLHDDVVKIDDDNLPDIFRARAAKQRVRARLLSTGGSLGNSGDSKGSSKGKGPNGNSD